MGKHILPNLIRNRERIRKFLSVFTALSLVFQNGAVFLSPAFAATVPYNEVSISMFQFILSGLYSEVAGQPTGTGELKNGNVKAYPEGACIPIEIEVTNNSDVTGDILVSPVFDYFNGVVGVSNLEKITTSLSGNPRSSADNLNDFLFTGSPLTVASSFPTSSGGTVNATINGPYAGNNDSTDPTSSTDAFRHYNVNLQNVPTDDTAYVLLCGRLGLDASEYSGGASLSIRAAQGGQENVPIPVNQILQLPSITLTKIVDSGSATPDQWAFNVSPAPNGTNYPIPAGENTVVIENVSPDGNYTITEDGPLGYEFSGSGPNTNCSFGNSTATATVAAGKPNSNTTPLVNAVCTFHNELSEADLIVRKDLDTDNDGQVDQTNVDTWTWDLDGGNQNFPTGSTQSVLIGTHTISEDLQNGWHVVDLTCGGQTLGAITGSDVNVPVQGLECIFTNARDTGTITVLKDIDWDESGVIGDHPNDASGVTNWTWDIQGGEQDIPTGDSRTLPTGSYTVTEDVKNNFHLVSWSCTGQTSGDTNEIPVNLVSNEQQITCTFVNAPDTGSISGYKYEDADGDPNTTGDQSGKEGWEIKLYRCLFNFSQCDELVDQVLTDINGFFSFDNLVPGFYRVVEEIRAGWSNLTATFINIVLDPGEEDQNNNFINTELGTIIVEKQTVPDSAPGSFTFTGDVTGTISDGQQLIVPDLLPGTYTSTENDPTPEYDLTSIVCDDTDSLGDLPTRTATFNLQPGETVTCVFTNTKRGSISGHKWNDLDGDGYWDGGEPAINGWTIFLDENDNKDLDVGEVSTTTSGGGVYSFSNLVPGDYDVCEVLQPGWTRTLPGLGCYYLTVLPGQNLTDSDFGNFENVSIKVCKYKDTAPYGQLSAQDQPMSGWLMTLKKDGQIYDSRNTGGYGCYTWNDLGPGSYSVEEEVKPGWTDTNGTTHDFGQVTSGHGLYTHYFLNRGALKICGTKYNDLDGDGEFDGGEPAIEGWQITITGNTPTQNTNTDENGHYCFENLEPGGYTITEENRSGWTHTSPSSVPITLTDHDETVDFFNFACVTIWGYKWLDKNIHSDGTGRGIKDPEDTFEDGWEIQLHQGTVLGNVIDTATTGDGDWPEGYYEFEVCQSGDYIIDEVNQAGYTQTHPGGPGQDAYYQVDVTSGTVTPTGSHTPEEDGLGFDFANFKNIKISGYKFHDINGNGVWDPGEFGLEDWLIQMWGSTNPSRKTNLNGYYEFTDLGPGIYFVGESLQGGWTQTTTPGTYFFAWPSEDIENVNFGNFENVSITVCKYQDPEGDGVVSAQDVPYWDGWEMTLKKDGNVYDIQDTSGNGCYTWSNLGPGSYLVEEEVKPGWTPTRPTTHDFGQVTSGGTYSHDFTNFKNINVTVCKYVDVNGDGNIAGDPPYTGGWEVSLDGNTQITGEDGCTTFTNVGPGNYNVTEEVKTDWVQTYPESKSYNFDAISGQDKTFKFGNFKPGRITVCKYDDLDGDGVLDRGELGIAGVPINISKVGVPAAQMGIDLFVTGEGGCLTFPELSHGTYLITELVPEGYYPTFPLDPNSHQVSVESGTDVTVFFLNARYGSIGDFIWVDSDGDKIQDPAEPGIAGVQVKLYLDGGLLATTTTDANGGYLFTNLKAGNYTVDVVDSTVPKDYKLTTANDPLSIQLDPGENELGADFGYKKKGEVLAATGFSPLNLLLALMALALGIFLRKSSIRLRRQTS